jgi:hypothetical protein
VTRWCHLVFILNRINKSVDFFLNSYVASVCMCS